VLLAPHYPIRLVADGQLSFLLHAITGLLRPSLTHYYGVICHLAPTQASAFTLLLCFQLLTGLGVRLPQLLHWLPVNDLTLKHKTGLTEYWASRYFARLPTPALPNQVHFHCVPFTSYGFLQTLPLASNALAIRILFPSVRVSQVSFNLTGLPASLGVSS
jgi:hypothetical protein